MFCAAASMSSMVAADFALETFTEIRRELEVQEIFFRTGAVGVRQGGWRMSPHLLALVVVLGLILGDAAGSLANGAQAHIQFR